MSDVNSQKDIWIYWIISVISISDRSRNLNCICYIHVTIEISYIQVAFSRVKSNSSWSVIYVYSTNYIVIQAWYYWDDVIPWISYIQVLLLSLLWALIQPLDVVCKGNFPMDTPGQEIATISMIASTRPNKLRRLYVYYYYYLVTYLGNDNQFNNGCRRSSIRKKVDLLI